MTSEQLLSALMARPAAAGGVAGGAAGYAGEQVPLLSLLDAPGRAVRGGIMAGLGQTKLTDELITTASFLPALAGVGAGVLSAAIPGLAPFAPWIGAGAAGLAQQAGETFDPASFGSFSSGDLNTALGIPSNFLTDLATNVATDPLTHAGWASKLMPKAGGYGGPAGTSVFIPEAEGAAAAAAPRPLTLPPGNLHMGAPPPSPLAAQADDLVAGWKPPVGALDEAMGMPPRNWMAAPPPLAPPTAPTAPPAGNLHMAGQSNLAGADALMSGWNPSPAGLQDAMMASPSQWQAAPNLPPTNLDLSPIQAAQSAMPGWMEQANAASMAGYAPGPQRLMPSLEQLASPPAKTFYGSVQPDVAQSLQDLGYMNATRVSPGGRTQGTLQAALPEWASYRKPWLTNAPGEAVPLLGDPLNLLAEQQQAEEAMSLFAQMLQGGGGMGPVATVPGLPPGLPGLPPGLSPALFGKPSLPFDPLKTRLGG